MKKPSDPRRLAVDLLPRSICTVKVGACVTDSSGNIIGWGWNGSGPTGMGLCAERHAFTRLNKNRLWYGDIYVAAEWNSHGRLAPARPCEKCRKVIDKYLMGVHYRDKKGKWIYEKHLLRKT